MPNFSTPSLRWQALNSRNPLAQNSFIYSVITTKIYCRPTCPSRLARRANIVFHDTPEEAERDGFRACMRCKPGTLRGEGRDPQAVAVEKAKNILRSQREQKWNVKSLAKEVGLTESHFCRIFKRIEGVTVGEYRNQVKGEVKKVHEVVLTVECAEETDWLGPLGLEFEPTETAQEGPTKINNSEFTLNWDNFSDVPNPEIFFQQFSSGFDCLDFNFQTMEALTPGLLSDATSPNPTEDGLQFLDFDSHFSNLHCE